MMKRSRFVCFLILFGFSTSCVEEDVDAPNPDYLVFGHFYGECMGESCVEIYKLEDGRLYEDIHDQYPSRTGFYLGDYKPLHTEQYNLVRDLIQYFPQQLMEEERRVIGEPDAGDWGGLYVEYSHGGNRQFWFIDQKKSNLPEYLHLFRDKVNEKIALINGWLE